MSEVRWNEYGQPIGAAVPGWAERPWPGPAPVAGRYCRIEKLDAARHAASLYAAYEAAPDGRDWTYLTVGPFGSEAEYRAYAEAASTSRDPYHYAILDPATDRALGTVAFMRIDPGYGVIEVGFVAYSRLLQRSRAGTETIYLLMRRAFDELGYRRFEWKCDSLNDRSKQAALRYGFTYEGCFRQARVYKGRNRDSDWFSIVDAEWPRIRAAFESWLDPGNFDRDGRQIRALATIREALA